MKMPLNGIAALAVLLVTGCDGRDVVEQPSKAPQSRERDPMVVVLNPEMAERVKTASPAMAEIAETLQVPGRVEVDEHKLVRVGSNVTGRIVEVYAGVGDVVASGKPLAQISSPELTQAQLAYLRAYSQFNLAERAADRARQLLAADVVGSAELQRRESELQVTRAELNAATDHLRILGVGNGALGNLARSGHILPAVAITASKGGAVIERNVAVGQVVQPTDKLFSVADLSTVWVVGGVPEQDARMVSLGQPVEILVPALLDQTLMGRIVFVADTVSPDTRTVTVRTLVENSQRRLKPAMLASMRIAGVPQKRLVVPGAAVVREAGLDHVFVALGNNRFRLVPVELGPAADALRPLLKGISAGQVIVVDGAFHLNNERKRAELEQ